jgi:hypothetical protein
MRSSSHGPQPMIKKSTIVRWMRFSGSTGVIFNPHFGCYLSLAGRSWPDFGQIEKFGI